jgi:hypothetical protein
VKGLLDVPRAAHRGHVGAQAIRELHRVRADATGRAVDEHLLACLDLPVVAGACSAVIPRWSRGAFWTRSPA